MQGAVTVQNYKSKKNYADINFREQIQEIKN